MSQEQNNEKSKKRLFTYYLILGACLLLIAAVTLTVIFAVRGSDDTLLPGGNVADVGDDDGDTDGDDGSDDDSDDDDGQQPSDDVSAAYEFIAPVAQLDIINDYTFYYNKTLDCYHYHTGLDIAGEAGTEVLACVDGTIESITRDDVLDGGEIVIAHADGVKTTYRFIDVAEGLETGDAVERGDVIGTIAQPAGSEYKEGAHLHFEVSKNGELADPNDYLDIAEK